jgi:hypothetical protein
MFFILNFRFLLSLGLHIGNSFYENFMRDYYGFLGTWFFFNFFNIEGLVFEFFDLCVIFDYVIFCKGFILFFDWSFGIGSFIGIF